MVVFNEVAPVKTKREQLLAALAFVTTVGGTVVANVAAGFYAGKWLDGFFETAPWGRIGGIIVGMLTAVWSVYKILRRDYINGGNA